MRVLLFGGSFNPVHWGHLILAEDVAEEFGYERVFFLPAHRSPFKGGEDDPGPAHRLAMLELACAGNPRFAVDDRELRRKGPSYTIDTVRSLSNDEGIEGQPGLLLGDDLVAGFGRWRESAALAREACIVIARRGGEESSGQHDFLKASNRLIPISSSEVRERLASGRGIRYLVPEGVREYILEKGLYGSR
jgi:nicotinate-nucleotide adenylyltransferase